MCLPVSLPRYSASAAAASVETSSVKYSIECQEFILLKMTKGKSGLGHTQRRSDVQPSNGLDDVGVICDGSNGLEAGISGEQLLCARLPPSHPQIKLKTERRRKLTSASACVKLNWLISLISSAYRAGRKIFVTVSVMSWNGSFVF